jgi:hypothetical protein
VRAGNAARGERGPAVGFGRVAPVVVRARIGLKYSFRG